MSAVLERGAGAAELRTRALLIGTMAIWGLNLSAVKVLTASFDTLVLAAVRMLVACVVLSALLLLRRTAWPALQGRQLAAVAGCGLLMVYANQVLFTTGLAHTTAANAALIMALSPLASSLLAAALFGERLGAMRLVGIAIGFGGVAAVVLHRPGAALGSGSLGDLLIAASVLTFAGGSMGVQRLARRLDALAISWGVHVVGASLLLLHALLAGPASHFMPAGATAGTWGLVLFSGAVATALAAVVWNQAIGRLGAARTALALYWVPVFGVAFAVLCLGEAVSAWHFVGLVAVMAGTALGRRH